MQKIFINIILGFFSFLFIFVVNASSYPNDSIYNLNSKFIDHNGKIYKFSDFSGKIQIFSMIYTRCKTICPIIISNMKSIEKSLPKDIIGNVNFLLVSLDPDRDSVDVLYKFFISKNFNSENWTLCKTDKNETLKIALSSGIKYKKEQNDEYTHSNLIILLDKNGVIKLHHPGLDKNYSDLINLIYTLL